MYVLSILLYYNNTFLIKIKKKYIVINSINSALNFKRLDNNKEFNLLNIYHKLSYYYSSLIAFYI